MIEVLEKLLGWVSTLCIWVASVALVVLIATFGWLVFGRYVMNVTPTWVEQLALLLICYIAFLGAAAGVRENTHLGVTLFRDMLPAKMEFGWTSRLPMLNISESYRTLAITSCGGLVFLFAGVRALLRALTFNEDWHLYVPAQEQ